MNTDLLWSIWPKHQYWYLTDYFPERKVQHFNHLTRRGTRLVIFLFKRNIELKYLLVCFWNYYQDLFRPWPIWNTKETDCINGGIHSTNNSKHNDICRYYAVLQLKPPSVFFFFHHQLLRGRLISSVHLPFHSVTCCLKVRLF